MSFLFKKEYSKKTLIKKRGFSKSLDFTLILEVFNLLENNLLAL